MSLRFPRSLRLVLCSIALHGLAGLRAQEAPGIQSGTVPGNFRLGWEDRDPVAVPVPEEVDVEAIPRFEDAPAVNPVLRAMPVDEEDAGAVEIPTELLGDEPARPRPVAEPMAVEADVEEKVDRKDSIIEKMDDLGVDAKAEPVKASEVRAQSPPEKPGQVGSSLKTRTEARTFTFSIPAPRGQILDRNGYPLAQNKVAYYAAISFPYLGSEVTDEEIERYAGERIIHVNNILGANWDLVGAKAIVKHYRDRRWVPLVFSGVLADSEVEELKRQRMEGLTLQPVYLRYYPRGQTLSHVIGYVGKRPPRTTGPIVNDEDMWGQAIGVDGLEQAFETELRGTPGRMNVLFEDDGTKVKEDVLANPRPGFNVVTSIDLEMQQICEELLAEKVKRGAMVVMDVRNGDIMAMASYPQFDPNDFIPAISQEKFSALNNDPAKPLFPRAFRGTYPAASTFKVVSALGFLESGYISTDSLFPCPNAWKVGNLVMRNWNVKGEGSMNVVGALTRSCNTWFYEVATSAGADSMSYMATRLGLGQKTG
ncbi:MAG TPA: penicillin-binding transpeptidase domain-containing protein, partial [Bacteroidia bacterium]|nr:penicillin-binding transpeptidase domain-containing protein [Bacteroidia bacterium]